MYLFVYLSSAYRPALPTYPPTYVPTCQPTKLSSCPATCINQPTPLPTTRTHIHTCMHTYMDTYIHTYIHTHEMQPMPTCCRLPTPCALPHDLGRQKPRQRPEEGARSLHPTGGSANGGFKHRPEITRWNQTSLRIYGLQGSRAYSPRRVQRLGP